MQFLFTNFSHRDETFELVAYIWQNPPSYVTVSSDEVHAEEATVVNTGRGSANVTPGAFGRGSISSMDGGVAGSRTSTSQWGNSSAMSGGSGFGGTAGQPSSSQQVQAQEIASGQRVDVDKAREALRLAYATRDVTADTINKLDQQGQQLQRIEGHLDNISLNLDKSDRLINGMESVFSYIGNKWRKGTAVSPPPVVDYGNRALRIEKIEPPLDIEILCKNTDDSFTPALLRLHTMGFACVDQVTGKPLNAAYTWPYTDLTTLVMRARHEHMDIKFSASSNKTRFRLMSSYIQLIVNELLLRAPKDTVQVVFEPGTRPFEYNNPKLSTIPPTSRSAVKSGFSRPEAAVGARTSSLLSATADEQTRRDLDAVDDMMDEVSRAVGDIGEMAVAMNHELTGQIEHLDRINQKVTDADQRIQSNTGRMNKLMS